MWEWYRIGLFLGLGTAIGAAFAGLFAPRRTLVAAVAILPAVVAAAAGYASVARVPRRARELRARRLDVSLADAGLPLLDRHRRTPRRAPDPAPGLVSPRPAARRGIRLLIRGDPCGGHAPVVS